MFNKNYYSRIPFLSVIVPVYNDLSRLKKCLDTLNNQTYLKNYYEVVVINNYPRQRLDHLAKMYGNVRVVFEANKGSYAARNKGIHMALGDILAFTDSDCVPKADWLETGVITLLSIENCGLVGGNIILTYENASEPNIFEMYDTFNCLRQKEYVENQNFSATANMFSFKHIFESIGYFNENLKSSGDLEWGNRVFEKGYALAYSENAIVFHPARSRFVDILRKNYRIAEGHFDLFYNRKSRKKTAVSIISKDALPPFGKIVRISSDHRFKGFVNKISVIFLLLFFKYSMLTKKVFLLFNSFFHSRKKFTDNF